MHNQPYDARFDAVFAAAVDGIILISPLGLVLGLNPAAIGMFGYEVSEVVGENIKMLMPAPYREEHDGYLARYLDSGEKRIIGTGREVVARRKDGSTFSIHLSVAEVGQGEERTFAGILHDISELENARHRRDELTSQLEMKNAELERFTYTVAHDLKSPLATIKGFAGELERNVSLGRIDRFRQDVARITKTAEQMRMMLDDLLAISRVGHGAAPLTDIPLGELIHAVIELLSASVAARDAEITVPDRLPTVRGDRTRLRGVFQNLIENAIKFSPGRPQIRIDAREEGASLVCTVRDHGIGVAPQDVDRIFGLFERLDSDHEGTGVGLALVRRSIEVHGGTVWAESEGLGLGTTFSFTLPLAGHEEATP